MKKKTFIKIILLHITFFSAILNIESCRHTPKAGDSKDVSELDYDK